MSRLLEIQRVLSKHAVRNLVMKDDGLWVSCSGCDWESLIIGFRRPRVSKWWQVRKGIREAYERDRLISAEINALWNFHLAQVISELPIAA